MTTIIKGISGSKSFLALSQFHSLMIDGFVPMISNWSDRSRQRRDLSQLTNTQLKDIGISRADVKRELSKSFWEA